MSLFSEGLVISKAEKLDAKLHHLSSSRKRMFAWITDHQLLLYTLPTLKLYKDFSYNSSITSVAISSSQSVLALGLVSGTLHFIDLRGLNILKTHKSIHKAASVIAIAISLNGCVAATASIDGSCAIIDLLDFKVLKHIKAIFNGPLSTLLSFTKDNTLIVGSSVVSTIKEVSALTGSIIRTLENPDLRRLETCDTSSVSGSLVFGSSDSRMRVFDVLRTQIQSISLSPSKNHKIAIKYIPWEKETILWASVESVGLFNIRTGKITWKFHFQRMPREHDLSIDCLRYGKLALISLWNNYLILLSLKRKSVLMFVKIDGERLKRKKRNGFALGLNVGYEI